MYFNNQFTKNSKKEECILSIITKWLVRGLPWGIVSPNSGQCLFMYHGYATLKSRYRYILPVFDMLKKCRTWHFYKEVILYDLNGYGIESSNSHSRHFVKAWVCRKSLNKCCGPKYLWQTYASICRAEFGDSISHCSSHIILVWAEKKKLNDWS